MAKENISTRPITMKDLGEFTEQVILPGVGRIIDERIGPLEGKIDKLSDKMESGFSEVNKSIRVLAGEIIEVKEQQKEFKEDHESRLRLVERKVGVR